MERDFITEKQTLLSLNQDYKQENLAIFFYSNESVFILELNETGFSISCVFVWLLV